MGKSVSEALFDVTSQIEALAKKCEENNEIEKELYIKYEVKRGLRDLNGKGVLAGLTKCIRCSREEDCQWRGSSM